jgi:outer membrane protein TolC
MAPKLRPLSTFLATLVFAGAAGAQATAPPPAAGQPAPGTPAAPAPPPGGAAPATGIPPMPDVTDPMLEPVPPAEHALSSWRDALRHVRMRSTTLHIAQAKVEQAEGDSRSEWAKALPTLTANGSLLHQFLRPEINPFNIPATQVNGTIDLRQPVFNLPAWHGIGTAKEKERSAALSEKDVQRILLGTIARNAVLVITSERIAESTRVSLALALSTANLTKRRAALGAANAVDVLRTEQEVSNARANVVNGDETLRKARESLGADLGYTGQWGVSPDIRVEDLERTAAQICKPVPSIDSRADVRAAKKALDAAERGRTAVDYAYAPTVDLTSQVAYTNFRLRSPSGDYIAWSAGAVATWSIFDGGNRYGLARKAEGVRAEAQENLTQAQRKATLETIQAERSILVARATLEVSTKTRDIAKEQARLSQIAYINGSGTSLELIDSTSRLRAAEIDLLNKQFGVFQAQLAAFLAKADCSI